MIETIHELQKEVETLRSRVKGSNAAKASVSPTEQSNAPSEVPQDFLTAMGVPTNPTLSQSIGVM
jgi:hypothetical protein